MIALFELSKNFSKLGISTGVKNTFINFFILLNLLKIDTAKLLRIIKMWKTNKCQKRTNKRGGKNGE